MDEIRSETSGPSSYEPFSDWSSSLNVYRLSTDYQVQFRIVVTEWIYQIVRLYLYLDSGLVTHCEDMLLHLELWDALCGYNCERETISMADIARGIALLLGDVELLGALSWNPDDYGSWLLEREIGHVTSDGYLTWAPVYDDHDIKLLHHIVTFLSTQSNLKLFRRKPWMSLAEILSQDSTTMKEAIRRSRVVEKLKAEGYTYDNFGRLLRSALAYNHTNVVRGLLELAEESAVRDSTSDCRCELFQATVYPALELAAKRGDTQSCETLLKYRCSCAKSKLRSQYGNGGPLFAAIANDDVHMVHLLLDNGEKVDPIDSEGKTPLHRALEIPFRKEIAAALLARGASLMPVLTRTDDDRYIVWTAMDVAALAFQEDPSGERAFFCLLTYAMNSGKTISATSRAVYRIPIYDGDSLEKMIAIDLIVNSIVIESGTRMRLVQWAIKHGELFLLHVLLGCHDVLIDQETKLDCRRVLQCFGWDRADFHQAVLLPKQITDDEIGARLLRYGRSQPSVKSFYWGAYWYKGQRRAVDDLSILIEASKLWFAEPGDNNFPSPIDEEFSPCVSADQPVDEIEEELREGGYLGKGSLRMDALDSTEPPAETPEVLAVAKDDISHPDAAMERHPSKPLQLYMISPLIAPA